MSDKQIDRKLLGPWKRLGALLIDFIMVFFFALLIDRIAVNPIAKAVTPLDELNETYNSEVLEYQHKEDKYHLYIYDENQNRIKNENVTEEEKQAFLNDERVITIRKELPEVQDTLQAIRWTVVGIDAFVGSFVYFMVAYLLFGKGRSISLMIYKSRMLDINGNKLTIGKCVLYGFLKWLCLIPFAVLTLFILPICMLYELFYKDNKTFLENKLNIECRIDIKDI